MKRRLLLVSALVLSLIALLSIGQETPSDDPAQSPAEPPATTAEEPPDTTPLETFEPTEKLSADSAVSFPVDI